MTYAQKQAIRGFLGNMTTVLPLSSRVGHPTEPIVGSAGGPLCPQGSKKLPKWQDRRIIPVEIYKECGADGWVTKGEEELEKLQ